MGLGDEYDVGAVDTRDTDAYHEAVQEGAEAMGLDDAHAMWREANIARGNDEAYAAALGYVDTMEYDVDAVYSFCADTPLEGWDGLFVSAVVDRAPGDTVRLPDLSGVDGVGYQAVKDLHIKGGVGDRCGSHLMGGSLHVEGDAGNKTGTFMRDGAITIEGDVDAYCGQGMQDGSITVYGDAIGAEGAVVPGESYLGEWMDGGQITVHGDTGDRIGQRIRGGHITVWGDTGSHAGYAMGDGFISVHGRAGSDLGHSMQGGTIEVGSTQHPVGTEMRAGTIQVTERMDGAWPPIGPDAHGDIVYGTGNEKEQVWPPDRLLGRAKRRNGVV